MTNDFNWWEEFNRILDAAPLDPLTKMAIRFAAQFGFKKLFGKIQNQIEIMGGDLTAEDVNLLPDLPDPY